jgi:hypothetical protein
MLVPWKSVSTRSLRERDDEEGFCFNWHAPYVILTKESTSYLTTGFEVKKIALTFAALSLTAGTALTADLPSSKSAPVLPPPPPPPPTWSGFYAGLNLGGGWSEASCTAWAG